MYLSSPNLQSPLAIKKMQDRVVNILLSHLVVKNEPQKLSWNIRTAAGNKGLPLSLYFYTEVQPLCKHFDISAWFDFENVPALYKINALEEGKYFFHIHFQLLDQVWTLYVGLHDSFFMALVLLEILFMGYVTLQGIPQACVPVSTGVSLGPCSLWVRGSAVEGTLFWWELCPYSRWPPRAGFL